MNKKVWSMWVIVLLICSIFFSSCQKNIEPETVLEENESYQEEAEYKYPGEGVRIPIFVNSYEYIERDLKIEDFSFIERGTSLQEVEARLGKPNGYAGSGMASKYYHLSDDSAIKIIEDTQGVYCLTHYEFDKDGKVIKTLLWENLD